MRISPLDIEQGLIGKELFDEAAREHDYTVAKRRQEKVDVLSKPDLLDKIVSNEVEPLLPTENKIKRDKVNSSVEAFDKAVGDSHPFAGLGKTIKDSFQKELLNPDNEYYTASELLSKAKSDVLLTPDKEGKTLVEKAYTEKMQADHSLGRFLGMGKDLKTLPGYDEWYEAKMKEAPEEMGTGDLLAYVGLGAAGGAAIGSVGGITALPGAAIGAISGAISYGVSKAIRSSDYGKAMRDTKELLAVDIATGLATGLSAEGALASGVKKSLVSSLKSGALSKASREFFEKSPSIKTALANADAEIIARKVEQDAIKNLRAVEVREAFFKENLKQLRQDAILEGDAGKFAELERNILPIEHKPSTAAATGPSATLARADTALGDLDATVRAEPRIGKTGYSPTERGNLGELRNFLTGSSVRLTTNEGLMKAFTDMSEVGAEKVLRKSASTNDLFGSIRSVWQEEKISREIVENNRVLREGFTKEGNNIFDSNTNNLFGKGEKVEPIVARPPEGRFGKVVADKIAAGKKLTKSDTMRKTLEDLGYDEAQILSAGSFRALTKLHEESQVRLQEYTLAKENISKLLAEKSIIDSSDKGAVKTWQQKLSRSLIDAVELGGLIKGTAGVVAGGAVAGGLALLGGAETAEAASPYQFYRGALKALEVDGRKVVPVVKAELKDRLRNVIPQEAYATVRSVKPFSQAAKDYKLLYDEEAAGSLTDKGSRALFFPDTRDIYIKPSADGFYALEHEVGHNVMTDMSDDAVRTLESSYKNLSRDEVDELESILDVSLHNEKEMFAEGFKLRMQRPDLFESIYPPEFQDHVNYAVDELIAAGKLKLEDGTAVARRSQVGGRVEGRGLFDPLESIAAKNKLFSDEEGNIITGYHGTQSEKFTAFDDSLRQQFEHGWAGEGHYFSTSDEYAKGYAELGGKSGRVIQANFEITNPIYSTSQEYKKIVKDTIGKSGIHTKEEGKLVTEALENAGYDAVIVGKLGSPSNEINVFRANNIRIKEEDGIEIFQEAYDGVIQASRSMSGSVNPANIFEAGTVAAEALEGVAAKVSTAVAGTLKAVAGEVKQPLELMREAKKMGLIAETVQAGQKLMPSMAQRALKVRDLIGKPVGGAWSFEDVSKIVGKTKSKLDWVSHLLSPYTFLRWYGKEGHNLAVELASGQNAIQNNTINSMRVLENILKDVKGISKANQSAINEVMKKLSPELDEVFVGARIADSEYGVQKKLLEKLQTAAGKKGADTELLSKKIVEVQEKMNALREWSKELKPKFAEATAKWETTIKGLAEKFPETRISLAAEDTLEFDKYPWLKQLMRPDELEAVNFIKGMHQDYAKRIVDAGEKIISEPFVHHSTYRSELSMTNLSQRLTAMGIDPNKSIPYAKFHSRGIFSRQMIPDIVRNMTDYIPDAEKRIVNADFWRVGKKDGWDYVSRSAMVKSSRPWREFFDRIKDAYLPQANTFSNKVARHYTTLETIRLLTFAPSAAFKHLFKIQGTWATMGFGYSAKHIGESATMAASNAVRESIERNGLLGKLGLKQIGGSELHDLGRSIIRQEYMLNALGDIEALPVTRSFWENTLNEVSSVTGVGIKAVENFDRAHSYLAAVHMASNKGMTAEQAMYSVYDNILKNNFLGGALNPSWMRNPKIRALALFQNTPFKILERRLVNALKSGESIKTAWGVMREQGIVQSLKELADIKAYIREGEAEFKRNLMYDALKSEKDFFGTPVLTQTVKEMVVAGATIAGGAAVGIDFWPQTWHTPFLQVGAKTPTIAASPIIAAGYGAMTGKGATAESVTGEEESFGVASRFLRQWLGAQGVKPLIVHKMTRINAGDIPEIYKGSKWQYLFSVPSTKED